MAHDAWPASAAAAQSYLAQRPPDPGLNSIELHPPWQPAPPPVVQTPALPAGPAPFCIACAPACMRAALTAPVNNRHRNGSSCDGRQPNACHTAAPYQLPAQCPLPKSQPQLCNAARRHVAAAGATPRSGPVAQLRQQLPRPAPPTRCAARATASPAPEEATRCRAHERTSSAGASTPADSDGGDGGLNGALQPAPSTATSTHAGGRVVWHRVVVVETMPRH